MTDTAEPDGFYDVRRWAVALAAERQQREALEARVRELEARLEIDACWEYRPTDPAANERGMVRVEIPTDKRDEWPDGIECRNDTIKGQDENIDRLRAALADERIRAEAALATAREDSRKAGLEEAAKTAEQFTGSHALAVSRAFADDATDRMIETITAGERLVIAKAIRALAASPVPGDGWNFDMAAAPKEGQGRFLAVVDGETRVVAYGKTSHVPIYGFCLADQGAEDFDLCEPTAWRPLPAPPSPPDRAGTVVPGEG